MATAKTKPSSNIETKKLPLSSRMLALEPRYVFDAALASELHDIIAPDAMPENPAQLPEVTGDDMLLAASELAGQQGAETPVELASVEQLVSLHNLSVDTREIAFVDSRLAGLDEIVGAVPQGIRIVLIDGERDGVEQIAETLHGESGITGIHIISHGGPGELHLGGTTLTATSMGAEHADEMASIRSALSDDGDILIYGCDVAAGATGESFVAALAEATGADVAASNDTTGHEALGGDWDLETRSGLIEAGLIDAPEWNGLLAPLTISTTLQPAVTGATGTNAITGLLEGGVGYTALWTNAGTIGGTLIDVRATVTSLTASTVSYFTQGDDLSIILNGGATATIKWEIFAADATHSLTIYAVGSPNFRIADIDGVSGLPNSREIVRPQLNGLTGYTLDSPTNLVAAVSAGGVQVSGTQNQNGEATSLTAFTWRDVSTWQVEYTLVGTSGFANAVFRHDGDGDFAFVAPNTVNLLSLDLDGNNSAASGTAYQATYTENGAGIRIADFGDVAIAQNAVLGTTLGSASIVLTNAQTGDVLTAGTLPAGISASVDTSVPGKITVTLTGAATVADYQDALQAITFSSTSQNPSTADRQIEVSVTNTTFGTTSNSALSTIHVTAVNDEPSGADDTISTAEDTPHTFTAANFGFSDPLEANTLQSVTIQPLTGGGMLRFNGVAVTAATTISAAQIGLLVYTPAANANGTGLASFTFQVQDNGGTANGGVDLDPTANTITFDVTSVNDAPVAADTTVTTLEDTAVTLSTATFGFTDPIDAANASGANVLASVIIDTLPASGTLTLDGVAITAGQVISAADIAAGKLVYTPGSNANGAGVANLTFRVQDSGGVANGGIDTSVTANTVTFDVTSVNDAPVAADTTVTTLEDTAVTLSTATFGFTDPIDAANASGTNALASVIIDTLPASGTLTLDGVAVTAGQVISAADITSGKLVWTPAANANGTGLASFTFQVQDNGGTANGGVDLDPTANTITFDVTSVNDAPVAVNNGPVSGNEDMPIVVDVLFNDSDVDDALDPTSVVIATTPPGASLSLDGKTLTVPGQGVWTVNATTGAITFTPDADYNGTPTSIAYTVKDASGAVSNTATVAVTVAPVNDAPTIDLNSAGSVADTTRGNAVTYVENAAPIAVASVTLADAYDFRRERHHVDEDRCYRHQGWRQRGDRDRRSGV